MIIIQDFHLYLFILIIMANYLCIWIFPKNIKKILKTFFIIIFYFQIRNITIDFYNLDKVKKIIGTLKNISKCDYKTLINDWIMTLFDIIVDHYLF